MDLSLNLDRKFCLTCQKSYPLEMVKLITTNSKTKQRVWRCTTCIERRSTPTYGKAHNK